MNKSDDVAQVDLMSARVCVLPKGITCSVCYFVFYLAINIVSTAFGLPLVVTDIGQQVLQPPESKQPGDCLDLDI